MSSVKSGFDINIVQQGDLYIVSGKDADALHAKMLKVPVESRNLMVGDLKEGKFTLQKVALGNVPNTATG